MPVFVEAVDGDRLEVGSTSVPAGLPLFDLDGRLVAVTGRAGRGTAFAAGASVERLAARAAARTRDVSYGVSLQDRTGPLERAFGPKGVVVGDVVANGPADRAGLKPGDLLLTIDGRDTDSAAEAMRVLRGAGDRSGPVTLTARSAVERRPRSVEMESVPAFVIAALARILRPIGTLEASAVFGSAALEAAGVPSAARLVEVNGMAVESRDDARRASRRRPPPAIVVLADDVGRFVAAIEAPR